MNKKLLVSVFFCFFTFSLGTVATEEKGKGKIIEHLVWAETQRDTYIFYKTIPDPQDDLIFEIQSDPFMTFHVPPSPKSEGLLIGCFAHAMVKKSDSDRRNTDIGVFYRCISDVIPEDIEVLGVNINVHFRETNFSLDYDIAPVRYIRIQKLYMRRNSMDWWYVGYKGRRWQRVPDDIALIILNNLIDNGFDVEAWIEGTIQGLRYIRYGIVRFDVSRIMKK